MTAPFSLQNRTVLLCDDEGVILLALHRALVRLGMTVVGQAASGEDAVDLAIQTRPDFVVMEHVLFGMDGIEAARRILADCPACIILMIGITDSAI